MNEEGLKDRLIRLAKEDGRIKALIVIGSAARTYSVADEYSDLDVIIATDEPNEWLYGEYPKRLGNIKISFVEETLGGAKERRIIYEEAGDVDLIIFSPEQLVKAVDAGIVNQVMNRGYIVMYDDMNITSTLERIIKPSVSHDLMPKKEFLNMVKDFFFHSIWAHKKIKRGELWIAKMCIDAYLKAYLLKAMEMYMIVLHDTDVWHNGRFLEKWLDGDILVKLESCFAHYDRKDMISALLSTFDLFSELCKAICKS